MSVVANVAINVDSRNAVSKLREVQGQAQQTERAFVGIAAAVGKLAIAFAGIQAIKFVFTQAAELQTQARSLQILAGSAEKAGKIIKELQDLGAVTPFTSTELIDSAKRLQAFGVEADKVVETTRRLADASGATGAELSGLVTAYGQVQAKGRLQGEELLQFQERGIGLQQELRKMYGMTGEEFQKALEKGQISAKAVEVALQRLTDVGGKYANGAIAQSDTLNGKLSTLQDSFQRLAQNIGTFFEPIFKFLIDGINTFLDRVNNGLRVSAQLKANEQAAVQTRQKFGAFRAINPFDQEAQRYEENLRKSLLKSGLSAGRGAAPRAPGASPAAPALLNAAGGSARGGGGRAAGGGADKAANDAKRAAEEAKRLAEQIREQTKAAESLKIQQQGSLAILRSSNDFEKAFVEFSVKRTEIQRRYSELTLASKSDEERKLLTEARALEFKQSSFELQKQIAELTKQATAPLDDIVSKLKDQVAFEREYGELIKNGTNPELAKQIIEINRAYDASVEALVPALAAAQAAVTKAEAEGASATQIQKYREELERIQAIQSGLPAKKADAVGAATELAKPKEESQKIEERLGKVKDELKELTSLSYQVTQGAEAIGGAFQQAFMGLVSGSMTAKEALASFFKSVADHFLDMASQMIAKMIEMFILQTILGIIGGAAGGGGGGNYSSAFKSAPKTSFGGALAMPKLMAEGGFVTGPTSAVIGEGGESEYVIPASKMQSAMSRYSRGARGEGVLAGSGGGTEGGGGAAAAGPMVVDVRYSVERINDVEYVTASAFQAGMRQAAQQGAAQGEQRTLRRLQQSPGTRKRVGM